MRTRLFHASQRRPARAMTGRWPRQAIAVDSFNRADSGTVGASELVGWEAGVEAARTWAEDNGTWAIASNKCVLQDGTLGRNLFDHGTADVWLEAVLQTDETSSAQGFSVRHDDGDNEWRAVLVPTGTNRLRLAKVVATVLTLVLDITVSVAVDTDYLLTCIARGSNWYLSLRNPTTGVVLASGRAVDSFNSTFTTHGLLGNVSSPSATQYDRYLARHAY